MRRIIQVNITTVTAMAMKTSTLVLWVAIVILAKHSSCCDCQSPSLPLRPRWPLLATGTTAPCGSERTPPMSTHTKIPRWVFSESKWSSPLLVYGEKQGQPYHWIKQQGKALSYLPNWHCISLLWRATGRGSAAIHTLFATMLNVSGAATGAGKEFSVNHNLARAQPSPLKSPMIVAWPSNETRKETTAVGGALQQQ